MNDQLTISKYGTRNWAVYWNGELLCVTLYKRGAKAVADAMLTLLHAKPAGA